MVTVLVAEDDDDVRELVALRLGQAGYTVRAVGDGMAALAVAAAGGVDLAVLNVAMSGMSGPQVCVRLRADPVTAGLPVIWITGDAAGWTTPAGSGAVGEGCLVKPFHTRDLTRRVQARLNLAAGEVPAGYHACHHPLADAVRFACPARMCAQRLRGRAVTQGSTTGRCWPTCPTPCGDGRPVPSRPTM